MPDEKNKTNIGVLGAGSWGNTLAFLLGQKIDREITLWAHDPAKVRRLQKTRRFKQPLVQKYLDSITITNNLRDLSGCEIIVSTIPLKAIAEVFSSLRELRCIKPETIIVTGSKGIEPTSLKSPSAIIASYLDRNPIAVFSGPNLAREMIKGKPMLALVASKDLAVAERIQKIMSGPTLRIYTSTDVIGVELCAALKNVIAIAAGCLEGLELGESAKASLITRGLDEMGRFLKLYNADEETLLSPAGIGDLIATCSSSLSRNYRVGLLLAKGKSLAESIHQIAETAEGINTCHAVYRICQEKGIQLPIMEQIKKILDAEISPIEAVLNLMNRPL